MATLRINRARCSVDVDGDVPLLWVLRDQLGLTGTKYGCGVAQCGACTVHINERAVRSCVVPAASLSETDLVTTIEGVGGDVVADAVRAAWQALEVAQCGYCQPGQIMAAVALLRENKRPSDDDINEGMSGNVCRCATYVRIRAAIHRAAGSLAG